MLAAGTASRGPAKPSSPRRWPLPSPAKWRRSCATSPRWPASRRTVFQHFADTAELYVAVLARVLAAAVGEMPDLAAVWPLDERISAIVNQFSQRGERLLPMWTFVETLQRRSTDASDMIVQMYSANREQLAIWFERELAALPTESRERTLYALAMALAPESWVVLRQRLDLPVEKARDELRFVVRAVFNDGAARR